MDHGIRNHLAFPCDARFSVTELQPRRRPHPEHRPIQGKRKNSRRKRRAELPHLTRNRRRSTDGQRPANAAVIEQLDTTRPAAAVGGKRVGGLMRSARG